MIPAMKSSYGRVSAVLAEALGAAPNEIKPTDRLGKDLGADSIDFLDIVFRLEGEFGIRIPRGELFPVAIFQGNPEFVQDGKVTDKGLAELRLRMPYADFRCLERDRRVGTIPDLFTVELVAGYIGWKLTDARATRAVTDDVLFTRSVAGMV